MYDNEEEIKRKRRTLIYISVGLVAVIIIVILMLMAKGSSKKTTPKTKLECELEVIKGTLGADGIYNTEVEIGFKKITPEKDITKKTVGERDLPRNTSTYVVSAEGIFKVNGYVQNVNGDIATCAIEVKVKPTKPVCELEVVEGKLGGENWYVTDVSIGFKVASSNNANTKINKYYIKEKTENNSDNKLIPNVDKFILKEDIEATLIGYIQDTNGSEGTCELTIKRDATVPTCKLKVESGTKNSNGEYVDNPVVVLETSEDLKSGVLKSGVGIEKNYEQTSYKVEKEGTTKVFGYVSDKAGNEGSCSLDVKKEVKNPQPVLRPTCSLVVTGTKNSDGSYASNATITLNTHSPSGATITAKGIGLDDSYNGNSAFAINTAGTYTVKGVVKDANNNTGACSVVVKVSNGTKLSSVVKVGDRVAYNAGLWNESKAIPTSHGQSGGYTAGLSKNNSVKCFHQDTDRPKNGWVVLAVSGETVYLVHAGTPECYFHGYGSLANNSINIVEQRSSVYINPAYATSSTILRCNDNLMTCSQETAHEIHKTGTHYYLLSAKSEKILYGVTATGRITGNSGRAQGIRPIITLKTNVMTTGTKDESGAWILTTSSKAGELDLSIYDYIRAIFDLIS